MRRFTLEGLDFTKGLPKICIPLMSQDLISLSNEVFADNALPGDLYEWRLDHYLGDVPAGLWACSAASRRPLLCTLRTQGQGGGVNLTTGEYVRRTRELIELAEYFQLIDIELSAGEGPVKELTAAAHEKGLITVVSQHDFAGAPERQEALDLLCHMRDLGGDIPKLAVMPKNPLDLFNLMSASWEASVLLGPVITVGMGPLGLLSRVAGCLSGSCVTFGAGERASAPGQMEVRELRQLMETLGRGLY